MDRVFACIAALGGFLGVSAGTFAAHVIAGRLEPALVVTFKTGVQYQMYHVLALFAIAWACSHWPGRLINAVGWLMIFGTVLFCGSLYGFSLTEAQIFGTTAAIGGGVLMIAWLMLALAVLGVRIGTRPSASPG